jgi:CRP-like cAMP-binding protein
MRAAIYLSRKAEMKQFMNKEILRKSKLFKPFSDKEISHILGSVDMRHKRFEKGEIVAHQGQIIHHIGILADGILAEEKYHFDGKRQIVRILTPYFVINLEAAASSMRTSPVSIVASRAGGILWMKYDDLMRNKAFSYKIERKLSEQIAMIISDESIRLMYKADILSKRTVRERILAYLSVVSERRSSPTISIGMNQEEFAHYLCVDRTSLSYELNLLRKDGMINYKGKTYTLMQNHTSKYSVNHY